jgi:hypothetical protein
MYYGYLQKNEDALESISMSGPFSKLNIHSVWHWWKLDLLEKPSRWSSVCHNIPCDSGRCYIGETRRPLKVHTKELKYNLIQGLLARSKTSQRCVWRRPQNMLERSEGPADWTKHHLQGIHGICRISLVNHPINHLSLDISPMWTSIIAAEV